MLYEELHGSLQLAEILLADVQRLHPRTGLVPYGRSSLQSSLRRNFSPLLRESTVHRPVLSRLT